MALLPPERCWHCLHFNEWLLVAYVWDNSGVGHDVCPDAIMILACIAAGTAYEGDRHLALMSRYGWVKTSTGLPFPLDYVWNTSEADWFELGGQYEDEGDADADLCEYFRFPGFQGGGWPIRWP